MTMLLKNLPLFQLLYKIPIRLILDWIAAFEFLFFSESKEHSKAVLKAHFTIIKNLKGILKKRNKTSRIGSNKMIVLNYFLRGARKAG